MPRRINHLETLVAVSFGLMAVSGCASPNLDQERASVSSFAGGRAIDDTPYSESLRCLRRFTAWRPVRVVVGPIGDHGLADDAALMTISALAKAGVPLARHFGTGVAATDPERNDHYILARSVPGSDYYLAGAVTGLDVEIDSRNEIHRIRLGLDLRLVDIDTHQLVDVISYQRQMRGRAVSSGAGEPVRLAVRSAIERAVLEMVVHLYDVPRNACASQLGGPADPLASPGDPPPEGSVALNEYSRRIGDS